MKGLKDSDFSEETSEEEPVVRPKTRSRGRPPKPKMEPVVSETRELVALFKDFLTAQQEREMNLCGEIQGLREVLLNPQPGAVGTSTPQVSFEGSPRPIVPTPRPRGRVGTQPASPAASASSGVQPDRPVPVVRREPKIPL